MEHIYVLVMLTFMNIKIERLALSQIYLRPNYLAQPLVTSHLHHTPVLPTAARNCMRANYESVYCKMLCKYVADAGLQFRRRSI